MNFYKEYNRIEYKYKGNKEAEECFIELSKIFSDLLIQLKNQFVKPEKNKGGH